MITNASNHRIKSRKVKRYGDSALFLSLHTTGFFRRLFKKEGLVFWDLLKAFVALNTACLAFAGGAFWRYRHGQQTTGLALALMTLVLMLAFNSCAVHFAWKPLVLVFWPLVAYWQWENLPELILTETHSPALFAYTAFFAVLALLHTAFIYAGQSNSDPSKRGESWLYALVFKRLGAVRETAVQMILEPLLTGAVGVLFWTEFEDPAFAVFLWLCALCMALQDGLDEANDLHSNSMLPRSG